MVQRVSSLLKGKEAAEAQEERSILWKILATLSESRESKWSRRLSRQPA